MWYPQRRVQDEHKQKNRVTIQYNGFEYSRGVLTVKLRTIVNENDSAVMALLVEDGVNKHLKPTAQVALLVGRYTFAASAQMESCKESYNWQSEDHQLWLVVCKDRQPMTARVIVIYGRSCNTLYGPVLSDYTFSDVPKTILTFSRTFESEYGFPFTEVTREDTGANC